jgi:hypothetical protein
MHATAERESAAPEEAAGERTAVSAPAAALLDLQRRAGNAAAVAAVGGRPARPSAASAVARADDAALLADGGRQLSRAVDRRRKIVLATIPIAAVQREASDTPTPTTGGDGATSSVVTDQVRSLPAVDVSDADGREIAAAFITAMAPFGATVSPFPGDDLVATTETPDGPTVATWPADRRLLQRAPGMGLKFEGGFVGAIQFCYDFCSGEVSATGWVWAGGGVVRKALWGKGESFYGAYVFAEKEFGKWQTDWPKFGFCGTCAPECKPDGTFEWGAGFTGFPKIVKPDEKIQVKASGVELGVLLHPHANLCEADLEAIALIDITRWLGPIGRAVSAAQDQLNEWGKRLDLHVDCGVGIAVSGTLHLCRGANSLVALDVAKLCGGGYAGCNVGLSRNKAELPGGGH